MLFLHTLLLKHGVHPCDFHTNFCSNPELLCLMLYLQCVITSMTPSLLGASTCCPSAPGTLVLPVLHTAWNEGQPMAAQCLCSHLTHLRHKELISSLPIPTKPSNKPVPTHHTNIRAVAISNIHSAQPSAELPQTRHLSTACPLTEFITAQQPVLPWSRSDSANNISHLTDLRLKGHVIFHQKKNIASKS